jgi:hypothetical protein
MKLIKFVDAEQAKTVYSSKNVKKKLLETSAAIQFNPLTPKLNPSAQRCLPRFCTGDFNF